MQLEKNKSELMMRINMLMFYIDEILYISLNILILKLLLRIIMKDLYFQDKFDPSTN